MSMVVDVLDGPQFDQWLADQQTVQPATDPQAVRGQQIFEASACAGCHAIAGLSTGADGPDLTALSTRKTIGAGVLENTPENLAEWITSVQSVKPGAHMLNFEFSDADLAALVKFLETDR